MGNFKHGLVPPDGFITYFLFAPLGEAAVATCLTLYLWNIEACKDMGVAYPDYANTSEVINEFSVELTDPEVTVGFQAGSLDWFKLARVVTVRRNSSFGTSSAAHMEPKGGLDGPEFPPRMFRNPCGSMGGDAVPIQAVLVDL